MAFLTGRLILSILGTILLEALVASQDKIAPIEITSQPPKSSFAVRDNAFVLQCSATGPVVWVWLKEGINVSSPYATISQGNLIFNPFIYTKNYREDVGYYQCVASNSEGSVRSQAAFVEVAVLSKFTDPSSQSVHVGDMVRFYGAAATASPPPTFTWTDQSGTLVTGSKQGRVHVLPNGALHMTEISLADSQTYSVRIENVRASHTPSSPATLTVTQQLNGSCVAKFGDFPEKVTKSSVGQTAVIEAVIQDLSCHQQGPFVGWSKDSQPINVAGETYQLVVYSLVINNVTFDDAGLYRIQADFSGGHSIVANTELVIEGPPVIETMYPSVQDMPNRGVARLNCTAKGQPLPTIEWIWNNEPLTGPDVRVSSSGTQLEIRNFTDINRGVYQCIATNRNGIHLATTYLTADADGPPGPVSNLSLTSSNGEVFVMWYQPSFPNGIIIDYLIYYGVGALTADESSRSFTYSVPSNASQQFKTPLPINSIEYESTYSVIIVARTTGGKGDPSALITHYVEPIAPSGPPLGVSVKFMNSGVLVSWSPPSLRHGTIVFYRIQYVDSKGSQNTVRVNGNAREFPLSVADDVDEVTASVAAATSNSKGDELWGPYSEKIIGKVSTPTTPAPRIPTTESMMPTMNATSDTDSNKTDVPIVDDVLLILIYVIPAASALVVFIIVAIVICCCCRHISTISEGDVEKSKSVSSFESKPIELKTTERFTVSPPNANGAGGAGDGEEQTTPPSHMRSFAPTKEDLNLARRVASPARVDGTPFAAALTVHAEQAPPPYAEPDVDRSRPPPPPVAPKPNGRVRSKRRRMRLPELHIPPAPADDDDDVVKEKSRLMSSPQRRMSMKEQNQLDMMMDELVASPTTQNPGDRPVSLEAMLDSGPSRSETQSPPPLPPPPPPAVDYLDNDDEDEEDVLSPPRPPPPVYPEKKEPEKLDRTQKLEAEDVLDDLMKQLELETENLGDLLDASIYEDMA